ncbi:MAG TPA: YdcF family protein, partial [Candidatus Kryptonia bacterium]|nr:YdcF family protein [Candidatus Kryptonia bacterium]
AAVPVKKGRALVLPCRPSPGFVVSMRRRWLSLVVLVAGGLLYLFRQPLLTRVGEFLVVDEPRHQADAIVVVSGSVPDRILEAVDLYHAGLSARIVLSREGPPPGLDALRAKGADMPERHDLNRSIAQQLGVPPTAITVVADRVASSTVSEANIVVPYLRNAHIRSVLLVTSKLHARRAGIIFRAVAGRGIVVTVCASHYDPYDPASWWHYRAMVRKVVIEYQKLLVSELWDRWRAPLTSPEQ